MGVWVAQLMTRFAEAGEERISVNLLGEFKQDGYDRQEGEEEGPEEWGYDLSTGEPNY